MAIRYAIASGNFSATSTWSDTAAGSGGSSVPTAGDIAYANGKTVTFDVATITCSKLSAEAENGATAGGQFNTGTGLNTVVNANVFAGAHTNVGVITIANAVTLTVNGNLIGGTTAASYAINMAAGSAGCTVNVVGNCTGGVGAAPAIYNYGYACTINVTGNVIGGAGTVGGISTNTSAAYNINITGNIYGNAGATGMTYNASSSGTLTVNGNVYGGSVAGCHGITLGANGGKVVINGNVFGGSLSAVYGISTSTNSDVTVNGTVYGGIAAAAINNISSGSVVKVIRAVGNTYGYGRMAANAVPGLQATNTSAGTYVEELEFGDFGQTPVSGNIMLTDKTTNKVLCYRPNLSKKILVDPAASNVLPAASNVRFGTTYNSGGSTGTCKVPAAGQVVSGVPVDATTGTLVMTPADVWNAATSGMTTSGSIGASLKNASATTSADVWNVATSTLTTSGSIGERLKNVSTVVSSGQQISNAYNA